eukprot:TRINITY_DN2064_c0_g1_i6.p1 TRINITY_DN2064_c0_g1~~TRINITY_DN2064_c0_g1_i6.p1  ORF type:complete len:398 (+),score=58.60 TRINITY_DN2064_c0_g1_i6:1099-2292(+)
MALISLRIQARVPVILMGETGIGKTALVQLLSSIMMLKFYTLNIHAGINQNDIIEFIKENSQTNENVVLFFDEINTNEHVGGLLKEVVLDRMLDGIPLKETIIPIAACNPYKLKKNNEHTYTQGLKHKKKVALSNLVYTVYPLPQSMYYFVWNYNRLNLDDEKLYVQRIIELKVAKKYQKYEMQEPLFNQYEIQDLITNCVFESQQFVRKNIAKWSVSLREVKRFSKLLFWFVQVYEIKKNLPINKNFNYYNKGQYNQYNIYKEKTLKEIKRNSIILSLAFVYQCRFADKKIRQEYKEKIVEQFQKGNYFKLNEQDYDDIIITEQMDIINRIGVPPGIAKNFALRENVFGLFVCVTQKIPMILSGGPGCGKTLSLNLVIKSLRGNEAFNTFLSLIHI